MRVEVKKEEGSKTLLVKGETEKWVPGRFLDGSHVVFENGLVVKIEIAGNHGELSPAETAATDS